VTPAYEIPHEFEREGKIIGQAGRECALCDQRKNHPNHDVPKCLTLIEFLLARIAEDEALLTAPTAKRMIGRQMVEVPVTRLPDYVKRDRKRWASECEAKRRIVQTWVEEWPEWHGFGSGLTRTSMTRDQYQRVVEAEHVLGCLALPYADHPDFRQEWAL
jgi:hypothetical protein